VNSEDTEEETMSLSTLIRRVSGVIAECNYAQNRMAALRTAPDRYLVHGEQAPEFYAEFLFRTSGLLRHEPSAADRARGQLVR
jgi:hypothetical protein